jgi:hypothetical protein
MNVDSSALDVTEGERLNTSDSCGASMIISISARDLSRSSRIMK